MAYLIEGYIMRNGQFVNPCGTDLSYTTRSYNTLAGLLRHCLPSLRRSFAGSASLSGSKLVEIRVFTFSDSADLYAGRQRLVYSEKQS
jgi:hypothetical protein